MRGDVFTLLNQAKKSLRADRSDSHRNGRLRALNKVLRNVPSKIAKELASHLASIRTEHAAAAAAEELAACPSTSPCMQHEASAFAEGAPERFDAAVKKLVVRMLLLLSTLRVSGKVRELTRFAVFESLKTAIAATETLSRSVQDAAKRVQAAGDDGRGSAALDLAELEMALVKANKVQGSAVLACLELHRPAPRHSQQRPARIRNAQALETKKRKLRPAALTPRRDPEPVIPPGGDRSASARSGALSQMLTSKELSLEATTFGLALPLIVAELIHCVEGVDHVSLAKQASSILASTVWASGKGEEWEAKRIEKEEASPLTLPPAASLAAIAASIRLARLQESPAPIPRQVVTELLHALASTRYLLCRNLLVAVKVCCG